MVAIKEVAKPPLNIDLIGEYVRWNNFLDVLPHPQGPGPLFTGQWNLYAQNPDSSSHLFAIAFIFLIAGHMYRTNFEIGHNMKDLLDAHILSSKCHATRCLRTLCLSEESLVIQLEEIQVDDKLHFVEEPVEIMDREAKRLKQSRVPIVKVQWNSRRGPEFTWERED
ncbi:putative reverse transcriptase domain-containing protein [Tanacetum coccineum]